jgi:endonuclease YncB( thermonuclease family)
VVRVVDGDTVIVVADLGWRVKIETAVRVDGINAPEKNTDAGRAARDYAMFLLPAGMAVTITSKRLLGAFEKYGRVLAGLVRRDGFDFAAAMIAEGHAKPWGGTGPRV